MSLLEPITHILYADRRVFIFLKFLCINPSNDSYASRGEVHAARCSQEHGEYCRPLALLVCVPGEPAPGLLESNAVGLRNTGRVEIDHDGGWLLSWADLSRSFFVHASSPTVVLGLDLSSGSMADIPPHLGASP